MKNTLADLNNYLFEQIERLQEDELTNEDFEKEVKKSKAIQDIAQTIISNANLLLQAKKHFDEFGIEAKVDCALLGIKEED